MERFGDILQSRDQLPMLDSATKYPSILTYHALGERGRLTEDLSVQFPGDWPVWLTEKVDGTNARIIVFPNGQFLIGSRDDLLYASGDFVRNQTMGIVETLLRGWTAVETDDTHSSSVDWSTFASPSELVVLFVEVYGFGIGKAAKVYAHTSKITSFRLFDVVRIPLAILDNLLAMTPERVAHWRDTGGQVFDLCDSLGNLGIPVVPTIGIISANELPKSVRDANTFLHTRVGYTQCPLTSEYSGRAEGLVLRTNNRWTIAKMRFEDYARTIGGNK